MLTAFLYANSEISEKKWKNKKKLCAIATKRIEDLRINLTKYVKD